MRYRAALRTGADGVPCYTGEHADSDPHGFGAPPPIPVPRFTLLDAGNPQHCPHHHVSAPPERVPGGAATLRTGCRLYAGVMIRRIPHRCPPGICGGLPIVGEPTTAHWLMAAAIPHRLTGGESIAPGVGCTNHRARLPAHAPLRVHHHFCAMLATASVGIPFQRLEIAAQQ